jgi:hypothetical protein
MNMDAEAFKAATINTVEKRDVNIRSVDNGFALSGQRRFLDKDTNHPRLAQNSEAIATTADAAIETAKNYLQTGSF